MEKTLEFYENSIEDAEKKGNLLDKAKIYEEFANFWIARGNKKIARIYIKDAFILYIKLNDKFKTDELIKKYPDFLNIVSESENYFFSFKNNSFIEHNTLLKSIFAAVPDLLLVVDRNLKIIYSNYKAHDRIVPTKNTKTDTCYGRFHLRNVPCEDCTAKEVFETGLFHERHRINAADNRRREVRSYPIKNRYGEVSYVLKHVRDIDDSYRAQQALLNEKDEKYRLLFENMKNGFVLHKIIADENNNPVDYIITAINPAFERITGISKELILNKNIKSVFPDIDELLINNFENVALTNKTLTFEYYCKSLDKYFIVSVFSFDSGQFASAFNDITHLKKTKQALEESKNQLQVIFNAAPSIIMLLNENCEVLQMNKTARLFAGQNHEDASGKCPGDVFDCIYSFIDEKGCGKSLYCKECVIRNTVYDTFINNNEHQRVETTLSIKRDNLENEYHILLSASLHEFSGQKAALIIIDNITELKNAQKALREGDEKFKTVFYTTPDAITITNLDGKIVEINEGFSAITSYTRDEVIGKSALDLNLWDNPEDRNKLIDILNKTGNVTNFEAVYRMKDQSSRHCLMSASLIVLNNIPHILAITKDITLRRNAEIDLEQSMAKYRSLFEGSRDGIITAELNGKIIDCNKSYANMLGYSIEELKNMNFFELTPEKWKEWEKNEIFNKYLFANSYTPIYEKEYITKYGKIINTEVTAYLYHFEKDKDPIIWAVVRDVTDNKTIQELLRQSQKMEAVGQLAGGIAHDFNNMLAGIIGYTEISLNQSEPGSKLEKNLMQILKASDRAKNLVSQILSFSRQSAHEKQYIYLRPILKEVIELLKVSIPSSVIIRTNIQKDTHSVYADPVRIHEIIMNLVTNAVHAMDEKGELTISLSEQCVLDGNFGHIGMIEPGVYSIIEVSDTGCGIDSEIMTKIFDPFFTTKPSKKGTGMGLSVVYGIIQSHNGNIQVESEVGKGSTFRIFLPKSETNPIENKKEEDIDITGNESILFVDDEVLLVAIITDLLVSMGYSVTSTNDSTEALNILRKTPEKFDLLITDQTMPNMTGVDLAQEALKIKRDLPIILCTVYSSTVDSEKASQMGIKKFLLKPITRNELGLAIKEVFTKHDK